MFEHENDSATNNGNLMLLRGWQLDLYGRMNVFHWCRCMCAIQCTMANKMFMIKYNSNDNGLKRIESQSFFFILYSLLNNSNIILYKWQQKKMTIYNYILLRIRNMMILLWWIMVFNTQHANDNWDDIYMHIITGNERIYSKYTRNAPTQNGRDGLEYVTRDVRVKM